MVKYVKLSDVEKMIDDAERIFQDFEDYAEFGYMASDINLELLPTYDIEDDCRGRKVVNLIKIDSSKDYKCPICGMQVSDLIMHWIMSNNFNYCPNCGIKFAEEDKK